MINKKEFGETLDLLKRAKCNLSLEDYINIWGEQLGNHIWRQEGTDILKLWKSGLTTKESDDFINFVLDNFQEKNNNFTGMDK